MKSIAVIIPCFNEERSIPDVIEGFRHALPEARIYVFDNNSTDKTAEIAARCGAETVLVKEKGKGNVVRRMFQLVDADVYVMVDGDDTYPPSNVREIIEPIFSGEADMVLGDRLSSNYFKENKRLFHNFGNRLITILVNRIFKTRLHDILTGYRAFSRRFVKSVFIRSNGFEVETELTAFALQYKFPVAEVIVPYKNRATGNPSKLNTFSDGFYILRTLLIFFRDFKPFAFFSCLAIIIALVGVAFLVPVFVAYFETGLVERFPTLIFGCFLLIASLLLFCSGLILQVITNLYLQKK